MPIPARRCASRRVTGDFSAWAATARRSSIRARAWSFDEAERIDGAFFERRIAGAGLRAGLPIASDACGWYTANPTACPGSIVDRYADTLVAQFLSAGVERWKATIADVLLNATGLERLYERSDASVRRSRDWSRNPAGCAGEVPPNSRFGSTNGGSRSTSPRATRRASISTSATTARKFADTGAPALATSVCSMAIATRAASRCAALAGGATSVLGVDSSGPALARARAHVALNGFDASFAEFVDEDVNHALRRCVDQARRFDAIVLDPPKFAHTAAQAERAARAYKDINRLAFMLLETGGALFTFSCSGGISADLFHKIVAGAGIDAGADGTILERLGAAPDHPMTVTFPEGEYLKGLVIIKR